MERNNQNKSKSINIKIFNNVDKEHLLKIIRFSRESKFLFNQF